MSDWFGAPSDTVARVAVTTVVFYILTFALLRLAGRRTLAEFSSFDAVITIAIGSIIASTTVSSRPQFALGLTALTTLLMLQLAIALARQRSQRVRQILDFAPEEIVREERLLHQKTPLSAQLTEDEIISRLRQKGIFEFAGVRLVILEPTGEISVLKDPDPTPI